MLLYSNSLAKCEDAQGHFHVLLTLRGLIELP